MDDHRTATVSGRTRGRSYRPPSLNVERFDRLWSDVGGQRWSTQALLAALDRITTEGWDGPTARLLLVVVRARIVVPLVIASRLQGAAAEQAEASGWNGPGSC